MTFTEFLTQIRPLVKASWLESLAGLPKNTLGKHYRWVDGKPHGQRCNTDHYPAIARALCEVFGSFQLNGWTITADQDGPAIFAVRPIEGRDVECVEVTEGNFEYFVPQYREVLDDFDFLQKFENDV